MHKVLRGEIVHSRRHLSADGELLIRVHRASTIVVARQKKLLQVALKERKLELSKMEISRHKSLNEQKPRAIVIR